MDLPQAIGHFFLWASYQLVKNVWHECQKSGPLDSLRQFALLLVGNCSNSAWNDLSPFRNEPLQQFHVFVVNLWCARSRKWTRLPSTKECASSRRCGGRSGIVHSLSPSLSLSLFVTPSSSDESSLLEEFSLLEPLLPLSSRRSPRRSSRLPLDCMMVEGPSSNSSIRICFVLLKGCCTT